MAILEVNPISYEIINNNQHAVVVTFTSNVDLIDVKMSIDNGMTYIDCISKSDTSATFDISNLNNGSYKCKLKGYYDDTVVPDTTLPTISNLVVLSVGEDGRFTIEYNATGSSLIHLIKVERSDF